MDNISVLRLLSYCMSVSYTTNKAETISASCLWVTYFQTRFMPLEGSNTLAMRLQGVSHIDRFCSLTSSGSIKCYNTSLVLYKQGAIRHGQ